MARQPKVLKITAVQTKQLDLLTGSKYSRDSGDVARYLESIAEAIDQVLNGVTAKQAEEWYGKSLKYKRQVAFSVYTCVRKSLIDCAREENREFSEYLEETLKNDMQATAEVVGNNVTWTVNTKLVKTKEALIGWRLYFRKLQNSLWRPKGDDYKDTMRYLRAEWSRNYYQVERNLLLNEKIMHVAEDKLTFRYSVRIDAAAWSRLEWFAKGCSISRPEFIRLCVDAYIYRTLSASDACNVAEVIRHCFSSQRGKSIKQSAGAVRVVTTAPLQVLRSELRVFKKSKVLGTEVLNTFPESVLKPFKRRRMMRNRDERFMRIVGESYSQRVIGVAYTEEPLELIFARIIEARNLAIEARNLAKRARQFENVEGVTEEEKLKAVDSLPIRQRPKRPL